jgi:plasmid maintenance system killer protein
VIFRTNQLRRNYQESARAARQWGANVGRKYVIRINELFALENFQQAYSVRSMHLHPLRGSRRGELSIHLTGAWRLIVTKGDSEEQVIVQEVSNHYDD